MPGDDVEVAQKKHDEHNAEKGRYEGLTHPTKGDARNVIDVVHGSPSRLPLRQPKRTINAAIATATPVPATAHVSTLKKAFMLFLFSPSAKIVIDVEPTITVTDMLDAVIPASSDHGRDNLMIQFSGTTVG